MVTKLSSIVRAAPSQASSPVRLDHLRSQCSCRKCDSQQRWCRFCQLKCRTIVGLRLDVHTQKLQAEYPVERTSLQLKICVRSSWEESVWRWGFGWPLWPRAPPDYFSFFFPSHVSQDNVWHSLFCFPTTKYSLLRYRLGATTYPSTFPSQVTSVNWELFLRGGIWHYWTPHPPTPAWRFLWRILFCLWHPLLSPPRLFFFL